MSLNDNVMDDIEELPVAQDEVVKMPGSLPVAAKEPLTVVPQDKDHRTSRLIPQEEIDKLPLADAKIQLVENGHRKLVDLKQVQSQVLGEESMCKASAQYVATAFEGLLDTPVPLGYYTRSPTKTNLNHVKKYMEGCLAKEEAILIDNFTLLVSGPLDDMTNSLTNLENTYLDAVRRSTVDCQAMAIELKGRLDGLKNVVFTDGKEFVNLLKVDLLSVDLSNVKDLKSSTFVKALDGLREVMKCPYFNAAVHCVMQNKSYSEILSTSAAMQCMNNAFTVADVVAFYVSTEALSRLFEEATQRAKDRLQELEKLRDEIPAAATKAEDIQKFLVMNSKTLQNIYNDVGHLSYATNSFSLFNLVCKDILGFIKTLD